MNTDRSHSPYSLLALCLGLSLPLVFGPTRAQAQVSVTFSPAIQAGLPGDTLNYTATFTNTDTTAYYIDSASFNSLDPNAGLLYPFFNGDPVNGDPITGAFEVLPNTPDTVSNVFSLALDPTIPTGTYLGTVTFSGQTAADYTAGTGTDMALGSADITAQVNPAAATAVPEPGGLALMGLALPCLAFLAWRRRASACGAGVWRR